MLAAQQEMNPLIVNVIHAALLTSSFYLIYDGKREQFKRRISLLRTDLEITVIHDRKTNLFSYFCFGNELTKEQMFEMIQLAFGTNNRKTLRYIDYFENESKKDTNNLS